MEQRNRKKIAVLGDGGWGTANALLLCGYGHDVTLWGAFPDYIEEMRRTRRNDRFLKGVALPEALRLTADCAEAVAGADIVVLAPPSRFFASVLERFKGLVSDRQLVVSLTKGLCEKTHRRMTDLARDILGLGDVVVLAGPTHAEEVSRGFRRRSSPRAKTSKRRSSSSASGRGPRFASTRRTIPSASKSAAP